MEYKMKQSEIIIRQANIADAAALRELRLEALQNRPIAFASDYEEESQYPLLRTEERLRDQSTSATFVAVADSKLIGMMGIFQYNHRNVKHNGMIVAVYVQPAWRGKNISGQMIEICMNWARERSIKFIKLGVESRNISAINSYLRAGFKIYGVESQVIHYEGKYYDELLMSRDV